MPTPEGFTCEVYAESGDGLHDLELLVRPGTDYDGTFDAIDTNAGDLLRVNGWLYIVEETSSEG